MSAPNDGGPAFPCHMQQHHDGLAGMTLLDYFAGQALAGIMANADFLVSARENGKGASLDIVIASNAYDMAAAMLAAREARK